MAKLLGCTFGLLVLVDGIIGALQPRLEFRLWDERLRQYFPQSFNSMVEEYARLSDPAVRYLAYWEIAMAGLILWLAGKARA